MFWRAFYFGVAKERELVVQEDGNDDVFIFVDRRATN